MFPMMDPEKMKPMEEDEAVKKMANIGAIMEGRRRQLRRGGYEAVPRCLHGHQRA